MSKLLKFTLPVLAIIILLITGTELYYVFLYRPAVKETPQTKNTAAADNNQSRDNAMKAALNSFQVEDWEKDSTMTSAIRTTTYEGKIVSIDTKGNTVFGLSYTMAFVIKGKGKYTNTFYFSADNLSGTTITKKTNGESSKADLTELKVGDNVTVTTVADMTKSIETGLSKTDIVIER